MGHVVELIWSERFVKIGALVAGFTTWASRTVLGMPEIVLERPPRASPGAKTALERPLGDVWAALGRTWRQLGPSGGAFGLSWGVPGGSWAPLGGLLEPLGGLLGRSWAPLGAILAAPGGLLGPSGQPLRRYEKHSDNNVFYVVLGAPGPLQGCQNGSGGVHEVLDTALVLESVVSRFLFFT